jgi:hypothetical protein
MLPKRNKALFVFGLLMAGMLSATCASSAFESGHGIPFRHLDNREVTAFAKKLFDETDRGEIAEVKAWRKGEDRGIDYTGSSVMAFHSAHSMQISMSTTMVLPSGSSNSRTRMGVDRLDV